GSFAQYSAEGIYVGVRMSLREKGADPLHFVRVFAQVGLDKCVSLVRHFSGLLHKLARTTAGEAWRKHVAQPAVIGAIPLLEQSQALLQRRFGTFQEVRRRVAIHHRLADKSPQTAPGSNLECNVGSCLMNRTINACAGCSICNHRVEE